MTIISMIYIGSFVVMTIFFAVLYRLKEFPDTKELVLKARREQHEETKEERDAYWQREIDKLTRTYHNLLKAEETKCIRIKEEHKLKERIIEQSDRAYRDCKAQIDANYSLAARLALHTKNIEELIIDFHKKADGLKDEIEVFHHPELGRIEEKYDLTNRKLIQMKK